MSIFSPLSSSDSSLHPPKYDEIIEILEEHDEAIETLEEYSAEAKD